jgi:hypothetical protein
LQRTGPLAKPLKLLKAACANSTLAASAAPNLPAPIWFDRHVANKVGALDCCNSKVQELML